jgi:hypothetical protein
MAMYQRRMASSTHALKESLLRRQKNLKQLLEAANQLSDLPIPEVPTPEEWEEMDDAEREAKAPITRSQNGLPIRVQIVARSHGDRTTIAVAALIELLSGGFAPPPGWD